MTATRVPTPPDLAALYEADETAWLEAMARIAARGGGPDLDYPHLAEYLTDMARRDRREVDSRLVVLLAHLLKWVYQPERRSRSWQLTVAEQRRELVSILQSKTLHHHAVAALPDAYRSAAREVAIETGVRDGRWPAECPFTLDAAVTALPQDDPLHEPLPPDAP